MKLNLWAVANRLHELEPEIHIPDQAPVNLRSARRAYADRCVYVYQKGYDVICDAGDDGGYLVFREAKCDQIFEMAQYTFDFYDDWFEEMMDCVAEKDYARAIDRSWGIFHNPILLLDPGNRLICRSRQYGETEVNYDWQHLCETGFSAVSVIHYLMQYSQHLDGRLYTNKKARIYPFPENPYVSREVSVLISEGDLDLGRLNIIEKDRKLNAGDLYMADYLVRFLIQILMNQKPNGLSGVEQNASRTGDYGVRALILEVLYSMEGVGCPSGCCSRSGGEEAGYQKNAADLQHGTESCSGLHCNRDRTEDCICVSPDGYRT